MLYIKLFGHIDIQFAQTPVANFRSKKCYALIAYLACQPEQHVSRAMVQTILWMDSQPTKAKANLRKTLSRIKDKFETTNQELIISERDVLYLNPDIPMQIDIKIFEEKIQGCSVHHHNPSLDCDDCCAEIGAAIALYNDDFIQHLMIDDENFENWKSRTQRYYKNLVVAGLKFLTTFYEYRGEYHQAINYTYRWQHLEPWSEEAYRQLMRLHTYKGERATAIVLYEQHLQALKNENLEPAKETIALAERIRQLPTTRKHRLPFKHKNLIRRNDFISYLRQYLVQPDKRLITLKGLGGTGKTTLALQAGWSVVEDYFGPFIDGVYLIDLNNEEMISYDVLAHEVADCADIELRQSQSKDHTLFRHLEQQETLFIIDNGELLGDAGRQFISDLLNYTRSIKCLVVSREETLIEGESVINVEGLSYPKNTDRVPANALEKYESLVLFVKRVQSIQHHFDWYQQTEQAQQAILTICNLTQGLPLALEMAAGWIDVLSCEDIAARIAKTLDLYVSKRQQYLNRHKSIRAVFNYSWQLLSDDERRYLTRLAIFRGEFDYEAVSQISGIPLLTLSAFIQKSLVQVAHDEGTTYYRLHNLLREFILELSGGLDDDVQDCYALYYAKWLQANTINTLSNKQQKVFKKIYRVQDNLIAVWEWALQHQRTDIIDDMLEGLYLYFMIRGWWQIGISIFSKALSTLEWTDLEDAEQAHRYTRLCTRVVEFNFSLGNLDIAESWLQKAQASSKWAENPYEMAMIYEKLGRISHQYGKLQQASSAIENSLEFVELAEEDHNEFRAHILMAQGAVKRDLGELDESMRFFQESYQLYQMVNYDWGIAHSLRLMGQVLIASNDLQTAQEHCLSSLKMFRDMDDAIGEAITLRELGKLAKRSGNLEQATTYLQLALQLLDDSDHAKSKTVIHLDLGHVHMSQEDEQQALVHFLVAFQTAYRIRDTLSLLEALALILIYDASIAQKITKQDFLLLHRFLLYNQGEAIRLEDLVSQLETWVSSDIDADDTFINDVSIIYHIVITLFKDQLS